MTTEHKGSCLCGAIHLTVTLDDNNVGACHCGMCRQWAGGPTLMVHNKTPLHITKGTPKVYASSDWAERGFCADCGTHLFYRLKAGGFESVSVGLFKEQDWNFNLQVYVDHKPGFYDFANQTAQWTQADVEAMFNPPA